MLPEPLRPVGRRAVTRRRALLDVFGASVLLATAACATTEAPGSLPVVRAGQVALVVEDAGPWREVVEDARGPHAPPPPSPAPARSPAQVLSPSRAPLPVPERRGLPPADPAGPRPAASPVDLARERHLAHPTRIRAQRITFRCPGRYAAEVVRSADAATEEAPGRVVLSGRARVTCRELTLEADRIVVDVRPADSDLHVSARGDVAFVTVQRGQVLREEGARSLLVTNDRVVPLR